MGTAAIRPWSNSDRGRRHPKKPPPLLQIPVTCECEPLQWAQLLFGHGATPTAGGATWRSHRPYCRSPPSWPPLALMARCLMASSSPHAKVPHGDPGGGPSSPPRLDRRPANEVCPRSSDGLAHRHGASAGALAGNKLDVTSQHNNIVSRIQSKTDVDYATQPIERRERHTGVDKERTTVKGNKANTSEDMQNGSLSPLPLKDHHLIPLIDQHL